MSRRVFVTGAGGFVGAHLHARLAARGDAVSGFGPETAPPRDGFASWHTGDLLEPETLVRAIAEASPDGVVHLAGQSSASRSFEAPDETFRVNALGTWHVVDAVRQSAPAARVLVVGSGESYGPHPEGTRVAEDQPFAPVSPYALSKAAADALADAHASYHGIDLVRTRSFSHTGPGQATRFVVPSFARQIARIERGLEAPVLKVGNLDVVRDISDVRDVVEAYELLLDRGRKGAAYNVCRGEGIRLTRVVEMLVAEARVPVSVEVDPARLRPADVPCLVGDPSRIAADTGWRATRPLEETLRDVIEQWRLETAADR